MKAQKLLKRKKQWQEIQKFPKRKISAEQLSKDLKKRNVLRETFGTIKFKKSVEEMMLETDRYL